MSAPTCPSLGEFAAALRDPARQTPAVLLGVDDNAAARGFAVHRNNVAVALTTALAANHPVTAALVGEAFFAAMAQAFFREHPPTSPVLAGCGEVFAPWVACFPPAAGLPYLADMARLERAMVELLDHDAEQAVPPETIEASLDAAIAPGRFHVRLQPALRVLRFDHGVVSLWLAHRDDEADLAQLDVDRPEHCLLLPDADSVVTVPIDQATAGFITTLLHEGSLDEAAQAWAGAPGVDITQALGLLIRHRLITAWTFEPLQA